MATYLEKGKELPLNPATGMIIAFKSEIFDLTSGGNHETSLELFNVDDDITLRITLRRGQNRVFFTDRAHKSFMGGWGQEQSVDLSPVDVNRWQRLGVTISVHDCLNSSPEQYQILFDLTTVYYFNKRFFGPVVKVAYVEGLPPKKLLFNRRCHPQLSDPLEVCPYMLDDLPVSERLAIRLGRYVNS